MGSWNECITDEVWDSLKEGDILGIIVADGFEVTNGSPHIIGTKEYVGIVSRQDFEIMSSSRVQLLRYSTQKATQNIPFDYSYVSRKEIIALKKWGSIGGYDVSSN